MQYLLLGVVLYLVFKPAAPPPAPKSSAASGNQVTDTIKAAEQLVAQIYADATNSSNSKA